MEQESFALESYTLSDSCKQGTFMDEKLMDDLQILSGRCTIIIKTINGEAKQLTIVAEWLKVANGSKKTYQKERWILQSETQARKNLVAEKDITKASQPDCKMVMFGANQA